MTRWLRRVLYGIRRFLGILPPMRWEDGVIDRDPRYAALYADVVRRIRSVRPDAIQSPDFKLTVRLYDRWPQGSEFNWGKVLAPNTISGDTGGTLCLADFKRHDLDVINHEYFHAITGIGDHPAWAFKADGFTLNV